MSVSFSSLSNLRRPRKNSAGVVGLATGPFLVWVPLACQIGRTSCIFWGMIGSIACGIWSACMTSKNNYVPFVISRWIGSTFSSTATTIGASIIFDIFYLHQRGKAFTFYTVATGFGAQSAATFSGFIVSSNPWPVQFWWTVGVEGFVVLLVALFLEETRFGREEGEIPLRKPQSWITNRIATLSPYKNFTTTESNYWKAIFPTVIISISPVTLITGTFLMIAFGWSVASTLLLSVFLQTPVELGGYGFTPLQNACFSFTSWVAVLVSQIYGVLVNDRIPLWLCRRRGGRWKPEYRLSALMFPPMVLLPTGLGLYGASLQYHLHYMVLALGCFIIILSENALLPITVNYVCECFIGYASEVLTILNFFRLLLGLLIPFFLADWEAKVDPGWVFGMMAFFSVLAFSILAILAFRGETIRKYSIQKFRKSEDGVNVH